MRSGEAYEWDGESVARSPAGAHGQGDDRERADDKEPERLEEELRERARHTTHQKPGQQYAAAGDPPQ